MPSDYNDRWSALQREILDLDKSWGSEALALVEELAAFLPTETPFTSPPASDAGLPDARKCPHPDGLFTEPHIWDDGDSETPICGSCGMAKFWLDMYAEAALSGKIEGASG